jgi:hypothetical protein
MSEDKHPPGRRSASAEAAALRWSERHPDDVPAEELPPQVSEPERGGPPRRSASAEAAALRYERDHPDGGE